MGCSSVKEIAQQSLMDGPPRRGLPPPAMAHARNCPECRSVIEDLSQTDELLTGACRSAREHIPGPSPQQMEAILRGASGRPAAALLLGRIRGTVRKMLWLTLLILSFLPLAALAWWICRFLQAAKGG